MPNLRLYQGVRRRVNFAIDDVGYRFFSPGLQLDPRKALILTGDPRSGSTWLTELITAQPGTEILWEPLRVSHVKPFSELGFSWRQDIPESAEWPEARLAFERLFSGQMLNPHICLKTDRRSLRNAEAVFVKFCRANQLLPWLTGTFEFNKPPLYLVRHPCAVVASQLRQGGWDGLPPRFEIPDCPFREVYR